MSLRHRQGKKNWSVAAAAGLGLGAAFGLLLLLSAALAWLVVSQKTDIRNIGIGAGGILLLSAALGAWVCMLTCKAKKLQTVGIFAGVFFSLLLSATALVFGVEYSGVVVYGICILLGAGGVLLLGLLPKKASNKRPKLRHYR